MQTEILSPTKENISKCAAYITGGGVVAFPTETVYGLGADIFNAEAVKEIYRVKGRPSDNPLIVHIHSAEQIAEVAETVPPIAEKLIEKFMPGALTIIFKKKKHIPGNITGGRDTVGVRMPGSEVCRSFLKECDRLICAPSANTSTMPSPTCAKHVYNDLNGKIPYILDGGSCTIGLESTILDLSGEAPRLLRAGGISKEELESVCGCGIETVSGGSVALCPGMKYKHYSPKANVLFSAYYSGMCRNIAFYYDNLTANGKMPVILCLDSNAEKYGRRNVSKMGGNYDDYARNLFAALREADDDHYDTVIAEGVPADGIGAAIINRLVKSSGGQII